MKSKIIKSNQRVVIFMTYRTIAFENVIAIKLYLHIKLKRFCCYICYHIYLKLQYSVSRQRYNSRTCSNWDCLRELIYLLIIQEIIEKPLTPSTDIQQIASFEKQDRAAIKLEEQSMKYDYTDNRNATDMPGLQNIFHMEHFRSALGYMRSNHSMTIWIFSKNFGRDKFKEVSDPGSLNGKIATTNSANHAFLCGISPDSVDSNRYFRYCLHILFRWKFVTWVSRDTKQH